MPKFETDFYIDRLRKMIRCKTISKRGEFHNKEEFMKLREVMKKLFPLIHEKAQIRIFSDDCWLYKLEGKNKEKNIMLMSHHDVVDENGEWQYPAFECEVHDGKIWGRGTFDTKTSLFTQFTAIEEMLSDGYELPCNLYIASSHNEEILGDGIPETVKYFEENNIKIDFILDEGGVITEPPLDGAKVEKCAMIAIHENGRYFMNCTVSSDSIYQDITKRRNKNPVERMTEFIEKVKTSNLFIRKINPELRATLDFAAPYMKFPLSFVLKHSRIFEPIILKVVPALNPQAAELIGTNVIFTKIEGASAEKKCTATAYFRPVYYKDFEKDLEKFKNLAKKYGVTLEDSTVDCHRPAEINNKEFEFVKKCIEEYFPKYPVIPFILPACTDARHFTDICPASFRFIPLNVTNRQMGLVHVPNENLDVKCIKEAIGFYKFLIKKL